MVHNNPQTMELILPDFSVAGAKHQVSFVEFMHAMLTLRGSNKATVKDIVELRKYIGEESFGGDGFGMVTGGCAMLLCPQANWVFGGIRAVCNGLTWITCESADFSWWMVDDAGLPRFTQIRSVLSELCTFIGDTLWTSTDRFKAWETL